MTTSRTWLTFIALCLVAFSLTACSAANQVLQQFLPTPSPLPTATAIPQAGRVGQRVEWGGWAVSVSNVLRSSLNPRERIPGNYYPDEWDYIGMDVTVERTGEERGFVYGEDFSLVDSAGRVYEEDPTNENWIYVKGNTISVKPALNGLSSQFPKTPRD